MEVSVSLGSIHVFPGATQVVKEFVVILHVRRQAAVDRVRGRQGATQDLCLLFQHVTFSDVAREQLHLAVSLLVLEGTDLVGVDLVLALEFLDPHSLVLSLYKVVDRFSP